MHSHHSHSGEFCKHASSTLDEVISRAHELGFTHFHLSEHVPRMRDAHLYPEECEAGMTPASLTTQFLAYLSKARELQSKYATLPHGMTVLVGCETENIESPHSIDALTAMLHGDAVQDTPVPPPFVGRGTVDYIVGSVHHVHGIPIDFDEPTFLKALQVHGTKDGYTSLLHAYLDAQYEMLERLRPEIIGHFDLYRLFDPSAPWYPECTTPHGREVLNKLKRNIHFASSYGALFETNSSAFRKGWKEETYPGRVILQLILRAHGRLALSDDSHGVHQVGLNYTRVRDYLLREGVNELWYLVPGGTLPCADKGGNLSEVHAASEEARQARELSDTPGRDAPTVFPRGTKALCLSDWHTHPFWDRLSSALPVPTP